MGFGAPPGGGNYPIDENYEYNMQNMTPEMEAKFLWLMDQAAGIAQPGWGDLEAQGVAEFTPEQEKAFAMARKGAGYDTGIAAWQPYMDKFADTEFDPQSYKQYMDPHQKYVELGITEQYDKAISAANMGAAGKNAFGGSRQGIMNAELLGGKALGIGQSRSAAFGTAMGLARGDFENQMQRYGTAAGMTQQLQQGDVASLMGAGSVQQQRNQQMMDAQYKADLTNRYDPQQRFSWMSDIFRGVPSGQMATTVGTSPMTNPLSQALGAGIFGAGVAQGWQNT